SQGVMRHHALVESEVAQDAENWRTPEDLKADLDAHEKWLSSIGQESRQGKQLDWSGGTRMSTDFYVGNPPRLNLFGRYLSKSILLMTDLSGAQLALANLSGAKLKQAILSGAIL